MALELHTFTIGPLQNNVYVLVDSTTQQAVVVDPTLQAQTLIQKIQQNGWEVTQIWITHGHFDHIFGVDALAAAFGNQLLIGLHPDDLDLWEQSGLADQFGSGFEVKTRPTHFFSNHEKLKLGEHEFEVRCTPGHSKGSVVFYSAELETALVGDLIFQGSIGRTDLVGGNYSTLIQSIREEILTLPPQTRLLSGHGPATSVAHEIAANPFLK